MAKLEMTPEQEKHLTNIETAFIVAAGQVGSKV